MTWPEFVVPDVASREPGKGCRRCVCGEWVLKGVAVCARCGNGRDLRGHVGGPE